MTITLLSKPACGQCVATKLDLDKKGLAFVPDNIYNRMDTVAELGYMSAPVVLVQDEDGKLVDHWSGYRADKIAELAGRLDAA